MTQNLKVRDIRDSIKAVAMDIAKDVAHHIEIMYPEAVKASPSTFLLSVRGATYNRIMAALTSGADFEKTLQRNRAFRRKSKAAWKKIRSK